MRDLVVWDAGIESARSGHQADHAMAALVAARPERAFLRTWRRPGAALSLGRYHRAAAGADGGIERRLSGGRVVALGPGVFGATFALPSLDWLNAGALRPDQVLNRVLRPLLQVLRDAGLDAFYPGRDLVTVAKRPLAYASFCPFRDDVVLVEQFLAVEDSFAALPELAGRLDPDGIAGIDVTAFSTATTARELGVPFTPESFAGALCRASAPAYGCEATVAGSEPPELSSVVRADDSAYAAFLSERGPLTESAVRVSSMAMLGVVEASCRRVDGRVHDVEICGDVIAPFETLDAVSVACEGVQADPAALRRTVARELLRADRFVLGVTDLEELVARLAGA